MDHTSVLANDVDCVACHADLVRGTGEVTRRECEACHEEQHYLEGFDQLTADAVRDHHRVHSTDHRARCDDCHSRIEHRFAPAANGQDPATLLASVRQKCEHCHPDHHAGQAELFLGEGGLAEPGRCVANPMAGVRFNCRGCHVEAGTDSKGDMVVVASAESCRGCHNDDYAELLGRWQEDLEEDLGKARSALDALEPRLSATSPPAGGDLAELVRLFKRARQNIELVTAVNGLHNKHCATRLLRQAIEDLERVRQQLPE